MVIMSRHENKNITLAGAIACFKKSVSKIAKICKNSKIMYMFFIFNQKNTENVQSVYVHKKKKHEEKSEYFFFFFCPAYELYRYYYYFFFPNFIERTQDAYGPSLFNLINLHCIDNKIIIIIIIIVSRVTRIFHYVLCSCYTYSPNSFDTIQIKKKKQYVGSH